MRYRLARKYKIKDGSSLYDVYTKPYADKHGIKYLTHWRGEKNLRGKWILTDNLYVIRVVWDQISCLKLTGFTFDKRNIYCVLPTRKYNGSNVLGIKGGFNGRAFRDLSTLCSANDMTRDGKIRWPIEYMFITEFRKTLNIDKAVKAIWPNHTKSLQRQIKNVILNDGYLTGLIMKNLRELFEKAGVDGRKAVRRLDSIGEALINRLDNGDELSMSDYLKLAAATFQINKSVASMSTEEGYRSLDFKEVDDAIPLLQEPKLVEG